MRKPLHPTTGAEAETVKKVKNIGFGTEINNLVIPSEVEGSSHF